MAASLPIKIEQGSTFKMKISLQTVGGASVPISGWTFDGAIKVSVYDDVSYPIRFEMIDETNGQFYAIVDADVSNDIDFTQGTYNIRFILSNGEPYRLMEGPVEISMGVFD